METLIVSLKERSYPIYVGAGLLQRLPALLESSKLHDHRLVLVSQKNIWKLHGKTVESILRNHACGHTLFLTPSLKTSEASKSERVWSSLIKFLASCDGKNKQLAVVAVGGGVIGDLAGFAASVYRRGIPLVHIPTTLTAQVDSAIGGKNGIDLPTGKNLLGTIYQPRFVLSDTQLLGTLPDRHWSDGSAEVLKYGLIKDPAFFEFVTQAGLSGLRGDPRTLDKVIGRCAKIKADIVSSDELDKTGTRMVLNFGHTAGHAIESVSEYSSAYTHGEAVGIGMLVACDIAQEMGVLKDPGLSRQLEGALVKFNLPIRFKGLRLQDILTAIGYDKKASQKKNRFILPVKAGKTEIAQGVPDEVILRALEKRKA